jgi:mannose-6-phosphate isomerase-like protein (cupin superfamily)
LEKVNLAQKFLLFSKRYSPKIVGELNDSYVKVVKVQGDFMWHHHDNEDELFFVAKGELRWRRARDRDSAGRVHHLSARRRAFSFR